MNRITITTRFEYGNDKAFERNKNDGVLNEVDCCRVKTLEDYSEAEQCKCSYCFITKLNNAFNLATYVVIIVISLSSNFHSSNGL